MEDLSDLLRRMSETIYTAAETVVGKPRKLPPKLKDGWSPTYIAIEAQLTALTVTPILELTAVENFAK